MAVRPAIILFAKAPVAGRVKTRLLAECSAEAAAALQTAFVRDMVAMLEQFAPQADIQLHTDAETDAWEDLGLAAGLQAPGDLGARMLAALSAALGEGRPRAMIVGSDAPTLPATLLGQLLGSGADVALGPTDDGGYYAIACRRTARGMFDGVEWSTPRALEQTVRAVRQAGLSVELGERWFDVDSPDDLARLARSPRLPAHTRRWLETYARHLLAQSD